MTSARVFRIYAIAAISAFATSFVATPVFGAPATPTITGASVDSALSKLTIQGTGLGTTGSATVTLDSYPNLTLSSDNGTQLVANLPAGVAGASYLLTITVSGKSAQFWLTIGAQGLQGPIGPQGPQGVQGSVGPVGPAGANGAPGPAGPQGQTGSKGDPGVQGVPGPAGAGTLRILDSNNNTVGYWIPSGAVLPIDQDFVAVSTGVEGFIESGVQLLFASTDCTGDPYLNGNKAAPAGGSVSDLLISGAVANGTLYYSNTTAISVFIGSYQTIGGGNTSQCFAYGASTSVFTPIAIPVSNLGYTPPFRLSQ